MRGSLVEQPRAELPLRQSARGAYGPLSVQPVDGNGCALLLASRLLCSCCKASILSDTARALRLCQLLRTCTRH